VTSGDAVGLQGPPEEGPCRSAGRPSDGRLCW